MSKTIDEVTQEELEQLYLENDWDVKKIAEKMGWSEYKIKCKFASFYDTVEKRQNLVYRFKIINSKNFKKLSLALYKKQLSLSINYYQIPLDELINSYKINNSFVEVTKKYKTNEIVIRDYFFYPQINTLEDYNKIIKEFNIKTAREFNRKFKSLYLKSKKLGIKLPFVRDFSEFIGNLKKTKEYITDKLKCTSATELQKKDYYFHKNVWCSLTDEEKLSILPNFQIQSSVIKYVSKFNTPFEAIQYYVIKNNLKSTDELYKNWAILYINYFLLLSNEEKELIFPGCTKGKGWEIKMEEDLQREFSDYTIVSQKKFDDCKSIRKLPFDFALYPPSGSKLIALIEVHGGFHFKNGHESLEEVRKRDIIKYEYCKKNNIPLFYFTYEPSLVEKYGYPYFVYTDFEELMKAIRELLQKVS